MFSHLIIIKPLGLLYASSGPFLSPENLVGRSGNSFPPTSATLSGLYAAKYSKNGKNHREEDTQFLDLPDLMIAGAFWAYEDNPENFFVPTPFNYLARLNSSEDEETNSITQGQIEHKLNWDIEQQKWLNSDLKKEEKSLAPPIGKFSHNTWIPINNWENPEQVYNVPWQYLPHLHPRLETNQRIVDQSLERGSLFLENSVQMHPETCLIYLTNTYLEPGWYRFGGEGHLVEIDCQPLSENAKIRHLLTQEIGNQFALITHGIWGSNRFSYRFPMIKEGNDWKIVPEWENTQIFTEPATTYRYRLGGTGKTKRLSRGRYAVQAGTVYILENALAKSWLNWDENWFPYEGYSFKRWGCALALPV